MKLEKITTEDDKKRRGYDDACGVAHGLELVGERWALLVMRELFWGPRRFSDLRSDLPGISANVLTQRLEGLEAAGIVIRRKLPPPANVQVYDLTSWGRESEPIFQTLGRWAARSPAHNPNKHFSTSSLLLSLRSLFSPTRAKNLEARIGFVLREERFLGVIKNGTLTIARRELDTADVIFAGTPPFVAAAIHGGQPFDKLEATGALRVTGNRKLAQKFVTLFPLPEKAEVSGR